MPREYQQRGRRAEARKRKRDDAAVATNSPKRQRLSEQFDANGEDEDRPEHYEAYEDYYDYQDAGDLSQPTEYAGEKAWYGFLDETEQSYFKRVEETLDADQFPNDEERQLFITNVFKEADGKELKLACSQGSSRLLERLISQSETPQLKALFRKFSSHFLNLVQHRFASHCCETLFIHSAPTVSRELLDDPDKGDEGAKYSPPEEQYVSMENLFLYTMNELKGNFGFLATDKFASHVIRVLLLILSGRDLNSSGSRAIIHSKKKETAEQNKAPSPPTEPDTNVVPGSFSTALEEIMQECVQGLETTALRALATHPIGNPTLQLLVQLELTHFGKHTAVDENSVLKKLMPDDPLKDGTESISFANNLLYHPVGSRLLETVIKYSPARMFKSLYKLLFRSWLGRIAKHETAGYVLARAYERLGPEDLEAAIEDMLPDIPALAEKRRTLILRTLVDRCGVRGANTKVLAQALKEAYMQPGDEPSKFITNLLQLPADLPPVPQPSDETNGLTPTSPIRATAPSVQDIGASPSTLHASLLAQSMLRLPGPISDVVFDSLQTLDPQAVLLLAYSPTLSPILQTSLTVPHSPLIFRRKLITRFYSHIGASALHPSGSRLVDAIWQGTHGMAFARERVAEELAENEAALRDSPCGRSVWRNWRMDLYKRRQTEWIRQMRAEVGNKKFLSFPGGDQDDPTSKDAQHQIPQIKRATAGRLTGKPVEESPAQMSTPDNSNGVQRGAHGTSQRGPSGEALAQAYERNLRKHATRSQQANGKADDKKIKKKSGIEAARERFARTQSSTQKSSQDS